LNNKNSSIQVTAEIICQCNLRVRMHDLSIIQGQLSETSAHIGGALNSVETDLQSNAGISVCSMVTITSIIQTVILILMAAVSSGADANGRTDSRSVNNTWSGSAHGLYVAGSGDNPWVLPQQQKAIPQGPAYIVNPHYVTPEDIKSDSQVEDNRRPRRRGPAPLGTSEGSYRGGQLEIPYGMNYAPGYTLPGYGGYYGGFQGMYGGAPGFGGDPMLYPYDEGMDLGDPYNLMMPPYSSGSAGDGN
jgi:hypothetical protein